MQSNQQKVQKSILTFVLMTKTSHFGMIWWIIIRNCWNTQAKIAWYGAEFQFAFAVQLSIPFLEVSNCDKSCICWFGIILWISNRWVLSVLLVNVWISLQNSRISWKGIKKSFSRSRIVFYKNLGFSRIPFPDPDQDFRYRLVRWLGSMARFG